MAIFHEVIDINPEPMYLLAYHRGHRTPERILVTVIEPLIVSSLVKIPFHLDRIFFVAQTIR